MTERKKKTSINNTNFSLHTRAHTHVYVCMYFIYLNVYCMYIVCMSGFDLIHTYSSDALAQGILKSFFAFTNVLMPLPMSEPVAPNRPRLLGKHGMHSTNSLAIKNISPLSDHTRTVPTTTRLLGLILKVNVCGTCRCEHPGSGIYLFYIFEYILYVCRVLT